MKFFSSAASADDSVKVSESVGALPTDTQGVASHDDADLSHNLRSWHVFMIAMGGAIGAGLYIGSAKSIHESGPSALISYGVAGLILVLVCLSLGELSTTWPGKGALSWFGSLAFGRVFGSAVGFNYWWFWIVIICAESSALGDIVARYLPVSPWEPTAAVLVLVFLLNFFPTKVYGNVEFCLAVVKVVTIFAFLGVGVTAIVCGLPHQPPVGLHNMYDDGFFAGGIKGLCIAFLLACTSYSGAESVSLVARESDDPAGNMKKSIRSIIIRISVIYMGSLAVVIALVPYRVINPFLGSFGAGLDALGCPHGQNIVDAIVFVALVSCLNTGMFSASRLLYSMGAAGDAPRWLAKLNSYKLPVRAVVCSFAMGALAVIGQYVVGKRFFVYVMESAGSTMLLTYLIILVVQLKLHPQALRRGLVSPVRVWGYPWLSSLAVIVITGILGWLLTLPLERIPVLVSGGMLLVCTVVSWVRNHHHNAHIDELLSEA